jgi:hypothetical protein
MHTSRADHNLNEINLPELNKNPSDVGPPRRLSSSSGIVETVKKPIVGEQGKDRVLSRYQTKIGKNFLLEEFLPPKQQIPSTTEGKFFKHQILKHSKNTYKGATKSKLPSNHLTYSLQRISGVVRSHYKVCHTAKGPNPKTSYSTI